MNQHNPIAVIGAGISGSEAAWQLAEAGFPVHLYEMRPETQTEAHQSGYAAELVCSNSFKGMDLGNAHGALKAELLEAGSLVLSQAKEHRVPAGSALAVDKVAYSKGVHQKLSEHPNITWFLGQVTELSKLQAEYRSIIVASGPLTSAGLSAGLLELLGDQGLYFYDAIAPVVFAESIDFEVAFRGSRYGKSGDDYINCPMDQTQYDRFFEAILQSEKVPFKNFEKAKHFEGCLPIEVMAERGPQTLTFGPFKPVGLNHPVTDRRFYAVAQLRQENESATLYNLVGCQTRMTYPEQQKAFRLIPGLENAEFARLGSMHRNSFINAPVHLDGQLRLKKHPGIQIAGQLTGAEGYTEAVATGFWAAFCLIRELRGQPALFPGSKTILGGLLGYLNQASPENFQPMNANWGLVDTPRRPKKVSKQEFRSELAEIGLEEFRGMLREDGR